MKLKHGSFFNLIPSKSQGMVYILMIKAYTNKMSKIKTFKSLCDSR